MSNNEMLSTEGDLVWDGLMENGTVFVVGEVHLEVLIVRRMNLSRRGGRAYKSNIAISESGRHRTSVGNVLGVKMPTLIDCGSNHYVGCRVAERFSARFEVDRVHHLRMGYQRHACKKDDIKGFFHNSEISRGYGLFYYARI